MDIKYSPVERANELVIGTGKAIIITGWTPVNKVKAILQEYEYACIGNLYSPMYGLNPLLVNLLANPYNWTVFVIQDTKADKVAGGVQCLLDFFNNGIYDFFHENEEISDWIPISDDVNGSISTIFLWNELQLVRKHIKCKLVTLSTLQTEVQRDKNKLLYKYAEPIVKKLPVPNRDYLPGSLYANKVEGATVSEAWLRAVQLIRSTGRITPSQYGNRQELIQLTSVIHSEPSSFHFEEWIPVTSDYMVDYLPQMLSSDLPDGVSYTYGSRLKAYRYFDTYLGYFKLCNQVDNLVDKLSKDEDSTQLTISLWNVEEDSTSKSPPCLTNIWIRLVENKIVVIATFRSHDMYTAYCANVMALKRLQDEIVGKLNEKGKEYIAGCLIINSQSAHIYQHSWQHADDVIQKHYKLKITYNDPVGNFIIEVRNDLSSNIYIEVTQTTVEGMPIKTYTGTNALQLVREIVKFNPGIQPAHIGYLGIELERAVKAGYAGTSYRQDNIT